MKFGFNQTTTTVSNYAGKRTKTTLHLRQKKSGPTDTGKWVDTGIKASTGCTDGKHGLLRIHVYGTGRKSG